MQGLVACIGAERLEAERGLGRSLTKDERKPFNGKTVFPILHGHLTFASHRCWTVYVKKAVFQAAECGEIATEAR